MISNTKILSFIDYYLPGFRAGGPVRSMANLVERLCEEFDWRIVTADRDLGDSVPFPGIVANSWNAVGSTRIYYSSRRTLPFRKIRDLVRLSDPDIVYLNSFFSPNTIKYLILRRLGLVPTNPVILAPRGELASGALKLKPYKKRIFMQIAAAMRLYEGVDWQASSEFEAADICLNWSRRVRPLIAPNLTSKSMTLPSSLAARKHPGAIRLIYLARISPVKNLLFALQVLDKVGGKVDLDVYGPIEDHSYYEQCLEFANSLSQDVGVSFRGPVPPEDSHLILNQYHFFIMPTFGENFGHSIFEAFQAGCPVLISDRTPWRSLVDKGLGFDLSLDDPARWATVICDCISMDNDRYLALSKACRDFAASWDDRSGSLEKNLALFKDVGARVSVQCERPSFV